MGLVRLRKKFGSFFRELLSPKDRWALATCCLLLTAAISLWWLSWPKSTRYREIINRTIQVDLEDVPQEVTGLEALVLSHIDSNIKEALSQATLDPEFDKSYQQLLSEMIALTEELKSHGVRGVDLSLNDGQVTIDRTFLRSSTVGNRTPGILFIPVDLLHAIPRSGGKRQFIAIRSSENYRPARLPVHESGRDYDVVLQDDVMPNELYLLDRLSESLQKLTQAPVFKENGSGPLLYLRRTPVQVFAITYTGINKTFTYPQDVRPKRFPPTTFFPSRPYFWPTFETNKVTTLARVSGRYKVLPSNRRGSDDSRPSSYPTVGDFFYVSPPYLDLGGSGMVITVGRGFEIDGVTQAFIGFDIPFTPTSQGGPDLIRNLRSTIGDLSGTAVEVACPSSGDSCISAGEDQESTLSGAQQQLIREWNCEWTPAANAGPDYQCGSGEKSDPKTHVALLSGIHVFKVSRAPKKQSELHFSIPIGTRDQSGEKPHVLLASMDVRRYSNAIFVNILTGTGLLAVIAVILLVVLLPVLESRRAQETLAWERQEVRLHPKTWLS